MDRVFRKVQLVAMLKRPATLNFLHYLGIRGKIKRATPCFIIGQHRHPGFYQNSMPRPPLIIKIETCYCLRQLNQRNYENTVKKNKIQNHSLSMRTCNDSKKDKRAGTCQAIGYSLYYLAPLRAGRTQAQYHNKSPIGFHDGGRKFYRTHSKGLQRQT
ncbi:MAG: hypothetical protein CL840_14405 [Crocinitomicaceae bacterium]|nr:hypothetical protein [Crocinitomicaceae bacterium]